MNTEKLASAIRQKAETLRAAKEHADEGDCLDTVELLRCLARIIEGKDIPSAFGAPGDWGYGTPIGAALAARPS